MNQCALCDVEITEKNDTNEHIIPNSIGGRRKVRGFICNTCNNKSGQVWDAELSKQLNHFNLLFMIKRERGTPPSERVKTSSGEEFIVHHMGGLSPSKPTLKITKNDEQHHISITARNAEEAKKMLNGLKRKYSNIDTDDILKNLEDKKEYLSEPLNFSASFGGPKAGRSLVKSALSLCYDVGIAPLKCEKAIQYLRTETGEPCFGYFYSRDLILNRPAKTPLHCVHIYGNPSTGLLVSYIEYFGIQRIIACLSDNYDGIEISRTYAINPMNGSELDLNIVLKTISQDEINKTYEYDNYQYQNAIKAFDQVMPLALEMSFEREKNRVISDAIENAFRNCGAKEGEQLTDEHLRKIVNEVVKNISPFLFHHIKK